MKKNIKIPDLNLELMNLYYQDGSMNTNELELYPAFVKFDQKTGVETGVEDILNSEVNASVITLRMELEAPDLGDFMCNAALCLSEDSNEYEPDFEDMEYRDYIVEWTKFISKDQQIANFNFYMKELNKANNFKRLKIIRESVLSGQKGDLGWFFMQPEDASTFWNAYNAKKVKLNSYKRK